MKVLLQVGGQSLIDIDLNEEHVFPFLFAIPYLLTPVDELPFEEKEILQTDKYIYTIRKEENRVVFGYYIKDLNTSEKNKD